MCVMEDLPCGPPGVDEEAGSDLERGCGDLACGIGIVGVHQHDAGDIRDDTGARFYRARKAPEGAKGTM